MASVVTKPCSSDTNSSSHVSPVMMVQENGSRNKRKFRSDPPSQNDCLDYELSAENFACHEHSNGCDTCSFSCENTDLVERDLDNRSGIEANDEFHDADWSDLTESQLEELVLANLDTIFKSAIKNIVSFGYTKEVATKAVLSSGFCYGCNDIVSNIVNNSLVFLRTGQEVDSFRDYDFEDLHQMEKYILTELVCVVREVRPFFSTGDAMWHLLVSDMNVAHACTMDSEVLSTLVGDVASIACISDSVEASGTSGSHHNPYKPNNSSRWTHSSPLEASEAPKKAEILQTKPKTSFVLSKFTSEKENHDSTYRFSPSSQNHEEKVVSGRKYTGINKRESILRQKSVHLEKSYRTYDSKVVSRKLTNFGDLLFDKKLKSVSESTGINLKNLSLKTSSGVGSALPQENITETNIPIKPPALLTAETDVSNPSFSAKKNETITNLVHRVHELQNQIHAWTEWANQKVMQAARRLSKDKAELKTLKLEREEIERLKKEKKTLEKNTIKKLSEMENALRKASGQIERANSAVRKLRMENCNLRVETVAANLSAAESAASCQDSLKREKKTLMQFQAWEKVKNLFREEFETEKCKFIELKRDVEIAKEQQDQVENRWKQEEKAKDELVSQTNSYRIGRLEAESSAKLREELTRFKADKNLQRYKQNIEKLEKEISLLYLEANSLKIATLKGNINGSYANKLGDIKPAPFISKTVKRERECVMCLSEEMCVVFLPCAHQVVCKKCNELHEKQGMKDCPSCRGHIQRRICVRYARS